MFRLFHVAYYFAAKSQNIFDQRYHDEDGPLDPVLWIMELSSWDVFYRRRCGSHISQIEMRVLHPSKFRKGYDTKLDGLATRGVSDTTIANEARDIDAGQFLPAHDIRNQRNET